MQNCGACVNACTTLHGKPTCANGQCLTASYDVGYADYAGKPGNGCDTVHGFKTTSAPRRVPRRAAGPGDHGPGRPPSRSTTLTRPACSIAPREPQLSDDAASAVRRRCVRAADGWRLEHRRTRPT